MVLIAGLAGRERLGDDSWLRLDEEEDFATVVVEAVAGRDAVEGVTEDFSGICAGSAGSGGGSCGFGDSEAPLRFPSEGAMFEDGAGKALTRGEYCVPASMEILGEGLFDFDNGLLCEADGVGICREKAAG